MQMTFLIIWIVVSIVLIAISIAFDIGQLHRLDKITKKRDKTTEESRYKIFKMYRLYYRRESMIFWFKFVITIAAVAVAIIFWLKFSNWSLETANDWLTVGGTVVSFCYFMFTYAFKVWKNEYRSKKKSFSVISTDKQLEKANERLFILSSNINIISTDNLKKNNAYSIYENEKFNQYNELMIKESKEILLGISEYHVFVEKYKKEMANKF